MFTLSNLIADTYMKLGGIGFGELPLPVLLTHLYDCLDRHFLEMKISDQNWLVDNFILNIQPSVFDYSIPAMNFGGPVIVEASMDGGMTWSEVKIVNFLFAKDFSAQGDTAVAFYQDVNGAGWLRTTFDVGQMILLRVWFEPDMPAPRGLSDTPGLPQLFRYLISTEVAAMVLPFANIEDNKKVALEKTLGIQIANWADMWQSEIFRTRSLGRQGRPPFRAGT